MELETKNSKALACPVHTLVKQCYTCKSWQGDKKKVIEQMMAYPISMDKFKGWPESGQCGIAYEWSDLYVHGDATATLEVNANFCCPYWNA